jgi:hypothetical protein
MNIIDLATRKQAEYEIVLACAVTIAGDPAYAALKDWKPEVQLEVKNFWPLIPTLLRGDYHSNFYNYFNGLPHGFWVIQRWESIYADIVPAEVISTYDAIPWALKEIKYIKGLRWLLNHFAETLQQDAEYANRSL